MAIEWFARTAIATQTNHEQERDRMEKMAEAAKSEFLPLVRKLAEHGLGWPYIYNLRYNFRPHLQDVWMEWVGLVHCHLDPTSHQKYWNQDPNSKRMHDFVQCADFLIQRTEPNKIHIVASNTGVDGAIKDFINRTCKTVVKWCDHNLTSNSAELMVDFCNKSAMAITQHDVGSGEEKCTRVSLLPLGAGIDGANKLTDTVLRQVRTIALLPDLADHAALSLPAEVITAVTILHRTHKLIITCARVIVANSQTTPAATLPEENFLTELKNCGMAVTSMKQCMTPATKELLDKEAAAVHPWSIHLRHAEAILKDAGKFFEMQATSVEKKFEQALTTEVEQGKTFYDPDYEDYALETKDARDTGYPPPMYYMFTLKSCSEERVGGQTTPKSS